MASGHVTASKGRTHGCTDQCCKREESSCQLGAVHTWHLADLPRPVRQCLLSGWTHEAVRISRCARRCGGYTGRMYHCIERCGRKGVRKGAVGARHVVRVSVFNLCRTVGLQKRAGTIASCRPKCGPHLPRSDESWRDIGTSPQGSSTH